MTKLEQQEDILSAIVIAEPFSNSFHPLTLDTQKSLLPLCNIPLLNHTLELLIRSNVMEIFIIQTQSGDEIMEYIKQSKWSNYKINIVKSKESRCIGDILREMDNKLSSDFILINGDTVGNVDLSLAVEAHKKRRISDKNAIMTMVMKEASPNHYARKGNESILVLSKSNELVHYSFDKKK